MNFEEIIEDKNYFDTLQEAIDFRSSVWNKNKNVLKSLEDRLFDDFDIEDSIFIINDFFNKDLYLSEKIDVLIQLDKIQLEELVEDKILFNFLTDDIRYHIFVEDEERYYTLRDNFLKENILNIHIKRKYDGKL